MILGTSQFLESRQAGKLDHGWRSTQEYLGLAQIIGAIKPAMLLNHLLANESSTILPPSVIGAKSIDRVPNGKAHWKLRLEGVEFLTQQNVVGCLVGIQELDGNVLVLVGMG